MAHRIILPAYLLLASTSAFAQVAPAPTTPDPASSQAIPADEAATGSDIVVRLAHPWRRAGRIKCDCSRTSEQLARQPTATLTDFLRKVPQVQGFGVDASQATTQGTGGTNTTRGSSINLRSLGPQATLTLLDGQRLASSGVAGNYIDPNAIPAIAVERVEVVADGSSAIYGSDAVAGVVNFITRKDYDGVLLRGRYGLSDGYWLRQGGAVVGKRWSTGGFALSYEHSESDNLNGGERFYVRSDLRDFGGKDYRNSQCNPGNIVVGGVPYAIPAGGVTAATAGSLVRNTRNFCENLRYGDILPAENRDSFIFNAHQEIVQGLTLSA